MKKNDNDKHQIIEILLCTLQLSIFSKGNDIQTSPKQKDQILTCVDIISEGPISGLPFGKRLHLLR